MVTKKPKGLGRGLEALLGPKVDDKAAQAEAVQTGQPQPSTPIMSNTPRPSYKLSLPAAR